MEGEVGVRLFANEGREKVVKGKSKCAVGSED